MDSKKYSVETIEYKTKAVVKNPTTNQKIINKHNEWIVETDL